MISDSFTDRRGGLLNDTILELKSAHITAEDESFRKSCPNVHQQRGKQRGEHYHGGCLCLSLSRKWPTRGRASPMSRAATRVVVATRALPSHHHHKAACCVHSVTKYKILTPNNFAVTKTCGDVTSINGTFFQSDGYPSTFDRCAHF